MKANKTFQYTHEEHECSNQREHLICGKSYNYFHLFEVKKKTLSTQCDNLIQNQGDIFSLKENEIKYSSKCWEFWLTGFVMVTVNQKAFQTILLQNHISSSFMYTIYCL